MLETALDYAGYLDYITPLISIAEGDFTTTFRIHSAAAGYVISILEGAGVSILNTSFLPGVFVFDVPWDQADYAAAIIEGM